MRTVIDLPQDQVDALTELCRRDRISRAEAIRRALAAYLKVRGEGASRDLFGLWAGRGLDGLEYQERLREEWDGACERPWTPTS